MSKQLLRRDLMPGDLFVYLDSAPFAVATKGYGTVLVASRTDRNYLYVSHQVSRHAPTATPSPSPGFILNEDCRDRPVMLLRFPEAQ